MNSSRSALCSGVLIGLIATRIAVPAHAQGDSGPPTRAEFAKLQTDVKEQRDLIIQMLQTEQQRYDMLLRLLATQGGSAAAGVSALPATPDVGSPNSSEGPSVSPKRVHIEIEHRSAAVEGKVTMTGGDLNDVYVYVENAKGPPSKVKTVEIRQEGKQFLPRVAVVQTGTNVVFPNLDSIYHNVFSTSPRNSFDLGSYRGGDKPRGVTLTAPGVVEIFCNMHQKMSADVLVVPNSLFTKVKPDGSFRLEGVPVGQRKLVAWSPHAKAAQQRIDVTPSGAQVTFALVHQEPVAHTNKMGQAYGSYRE